MEVPQGGAHGGQAVVPDSPPLSPASAAAAAALANARWNPTKEQVAVLEGLYERGLRTPSAEQIQQITGMLREHGHIEGKNVFYWFQNHKARLRQKQKQDSFAYFSRLLRRPPPLPVLTRPLTPPYPHGLLPPPPPPAACSNGGTTHVMYRTPCYMPAPQAPAANAAYYHPQQMAVMYPRMETAGQEKMIPAAVHAAAAMYQAAPNNASAPLHMLHHFPPAAVGFDGGAADHVVRCRSRETLQLFPLEPTFVLPDKGRGALTTTTPPSTASASFSRESESLGSPSSNVEPLPFYDFFGVHSGGR